MESERKRACLSSSSCCSAEDRLSALPDGVLDKILSCLKAHQMVQTSVLAKRWRHLWRAVRSLDIDQLEIISTASTKSLSPDEQEKFDDFVDNLLAQRYGSLLDRFQLHLVSYSDTCHAKRWLRRCIDFSPRVLCINYSDCYHPIMRKLFSSSCRLTRLHLSGVWLGGGYSFREQFRSVCTSLEYLELKDCSLGFHEISSPTLKILVIINSYPWSYLGADCHNKLVVKAPSISYLHLALADITGISGTRMPSLVKASIYLQECNSILLENSHCMFLSNLFNVTDLELSGFQTMVAYEVEPEKFPIFENLRTLLIDKCDLSDNFQMLRVFLNSPVLQEVTVRHCKLSSGSTGDGGMAKQDMVPFQFQNLVNPQFRKLKSIIVYEDGDDICQLVNVLLDNSGNLKENKITLTKVARTA